MQFLGRVYKGGGLVASAFVFFMFWGFEDGSLGFGGFGVGGGLGVRGSESRGFGVDRFTRFGV